MQDLLEAISSFQEDCPTINKDSNGYNYKYSSIENILKVVTPLLKEKGLVLTQTLSSGCVRTTLFHIESQMDISSSIEIPIGVDLKGQNHFQSLGSAITYLRRYSIVTTLGLTTEEDADARGDQKKKLTAVDAKLNAEKKVTLSSLKETFTLTKEQETKYTELLNND